jgi:phosphatidylserine decarboxylase
MDDEEIVNKVRNYPIASEGLPFICGSAALAVAFGYPAWIFSSGLLYGCSGVFLLLSLFSMYFFRNPERSPPMDEQAVVAPADGTVIFVERVLHTPLGCETLKISIFMLFFYSCRLILVKAAL